MFATEQARDDVKEARVFWQEWQKTCDPSKLVFLDETGATTNMIRRYGRARGGARCLDDAPGDHWKVMTFIAGLRADGITAPWYLDNAMTGAAFLTYIETQLCPTLKPGDIVIADNLSSHKVAGIRELVEAKGSRILSCRHTLPRPQPHRAGLGQTQGIPQKSHGKVIRYLVENHRKTPAALLKTGMQKLLR